MSPAAASARRPRRRGFSHRRASCETILFVIHLDDWFAERNARGMLTRMVGAWVLVGLPVIAARIWWSVAAAIAVFVVTLTMYLASAIRYMHRHSPRP
jgi:hypothetical protein